MLTTFPATARIALLRQAVAMKSQSAVLQYQLAEALAQVGEVSEAATRFQRAYVQEPRIDGILQNTAGQPYPDPARLRDYASCLIGQGAGYSPVIAALAVGEAHLGNRAEVQRLVDYDRFFRSYVMDPPDGDDQGGFYRALAAEIKSDLKFYDVPVRHAIRRGWRQNYLSSSGLPASRAWAQAVRREVDRYIASLPEVSDHPFLAARPSKYVIGAWGVVSDGESYHKSHIHPHAWMSGVSYVVRPPVSREPGGRRGWLWVGPPEDYAVTAAHGWAERAIEPEPGNLVLMPGYFYHWTQPTGVDEERICIAFDVIPAELAPGGADWVEY